MLTPDETSQNQKLATFREKVAADLDDAGEDGTAGRVLAACQDTESDLYLLIMAVPRTALDDAESPDLWRTPDKNKFLVCINEEILAQKAAEINEEFNGPDDDKNLKMGEFISSYLPAMFERAAAMKPLDI